MKKEQAESAERLEKSKTKSGEEIAEYRNRLDKLQKKYTVEVKEKEGLGRKLAHLQEKLDSMTKRSGKIAKGVAGRHYKTRVFYDRKVKYKRILAELEDELKINPDRASVLCNLGHRRAASRHRGKVGP